MAKITVVTIGYRCFLESKKTLESMLGLPNEYVERIFVGRGYSKEEQERLSSLSSSAIFDSDRSIYSAMNVGMIAASGEYITYINSGDLLLSKRMLLDLIKSINSDEPAAVYASQTLVSHNGMFALIPASPDDKSLNNRSGHSGFIAPIMDQKLFFDEARKITSDGDWMAEYRSRYMVRVLDHPLTIFDFGGISSRPNIRLSTILSEGPLYFTKSLIKYFLLHAFGSHSYFKLIVRKNGGTFISPDIVNKLMQQ